MGAIGGGGSTIRPPHTLAYIAAEMGTTFFQVFFQLSSSQSSNGLSIVIALNRSHNSPLSLKCTIVFRSLLIHCVLEILQPHLHPHPPQHLHNHLPDKLFSVHYLPIVSPAPTLCKSRKMKTNQKCSLQRICIRARNENYLHPFVFPTP